MSLGACLAMLVACGPVRYVAQVSGTASSALAQAEREGAAIYAPFEFVSATEYLQKAREEASRSQFQTALDYGQRAEDMATKARALTRERKAAVRRGEIAPGEVPRESAAEGSPGGAAVPAAKKPSRPARGVIPQEPTP